MTDNLDPSYRSRRAAEIRARISAISSTGWALDSPDSHFYGDGESAFVRTPLITSSGDSQAVVAAVPPMFSDAEEPAFRSSAASAEANLTFIAAARDDILWLLDQLEIGGGREGAAAAMEAKDSEITSLREHIEWQEKQGREKADYADGYFVDLKAEEV